MLPVDPCLVGWGLEVVVGVPGAGLNGPPIVGDVVMSDERLREM